MAENYNSYLEFLNESPDITDSNTAGTVYKGYFRPISGDGAESLADLKAAPRWSIYRETTAANVVTREWASGQWNAFTNIWDNRASLTYHIRNF